MSLLPFQSSPLGNLPMVEGKNVHSPFHFIYFIVVSLEFLFHVIDIDTVLYQYLNSTRSCDFVRGADSMGDQPAADY